MLTNTALSPFARPSGDANSLLGARLLPDHQQELLLALVLHQLAEREPALAGHGIELILLCIRGVTQAESAKATTPAALGPM